MGLSVKNVFVNLVYYGVTLVALPWVFFAAEGFIGLPRRTSQSLQFVAVLVGTAGVTLQIWCIVLLQKVGKGTPSPVIRTSALVLNGPYRLVRNPLNIGELMVFGSLAAWFGSLALMSYAVLAFATFHLFAILCEEPANRQQFGDAYRNYEARVNRWWPRMPD